MGKPLLEVVPGNGKLMWTVKATFHVTISMRGQRVTGKIQRNNYHHGSCGSSLTGKTMSVFLIFTQGTHRNVRNRWVRSSLKGYFSLNDFHAWTVCNGQNSKEYLPSRDQLIGLIQDLLHQPIRWHWSSSLDRNRLTRIRYNWRRPSLICSFLTLIILCHFKSKCFLIITKSLLNIKLFVICFLLKMKCLNFLTE